MAYEFNSECPIFVAIAGNVNILQIGYCIPIFRFLKIGVYLSVLAQCIRPEVGDL